MKDIMICVAPYPGEKQEEKFPGKMDVADEVIRSCNAGACIAHLHVRDEKGLQTTDTRYFRGVCENIHSKCSIIIEGSTGGAPEHTLSERCLSFTVEHVEMGSLNLGSINMFSDVYKNPFPDIIFYAEALQKRELKPFLDCFDLSHFNSFPRLRKMNLIRPPYTVGLIFDIPDSLPYSDRYLDLFLREIPSDCVWFLVRHHAKGAGSFIKAIELGGHIRVGYEDGPFLGTGERARSNAELVEEVAEFAEKMGRHAVSPDRAREIMSMTKR